MTKKLLSYTRLTLQALLVLLVQATIPVVAKADNLDGAWSAVEDWPLIAIHAAITPDGRVLSYGTDGAGKQTAYFIYDIWDPDAGLGAGHMTLNNMTLTDIFCSSQIILPQTGDILIAGGDNWTGTRTTNTGNNNSNLFDYGDNTLARSADMNRARWYSSSTVLVDGEIYIQGGTGGSDRPEVRQLDGGFRLLSDAPTGGYATLFPRNFLSADGRVFGYDTSGKMYFVDASGTGAISPAGTFSSSYVGWTSGAAMFAPGRILQMGGNSSGVVVIDINGPEPVVTPTDSLSSRRHWVSATVLADGKILATGGSSSENQLRGVNNHAEIWDPATGLWHVGAEGALARLYHSSALLLPDASVLVAGGGAPGPLVNTNAEIYYPPYLFASDGSFATRPQIISAPDTAEVGDRLTVQVGDSVIDRVTLVKTGSVTHSVNMDQRFIELPFNTSGNMLEASLPERSTDTPPGYYMLFVIDDAGVPSASTMLRINIDSTPNTAVDFTPAIGGGGGSPFWLACNSDEILVGVHGKYATYVNQVGPQCVRMDQFGRWIDDPVDRPVTGNTSSGTSFSRTCPRDFGMSGFRGRAGQYVNRLEIECRALTPSGGLTGAGQFLDGDGGGGGTAQGPFRCGTDNPVYALYGRSGDWLDNIGVQCRNAPVMQISVNSDPVIVNPGDQSSVINKAVNLQIRATDGDFDPLTYSATGLPPGLSINAATGLISGAPTTEGEYAVGLMVSDGQAADTTSLIWTIQNAALSVEPMAPQPDRVIGEQISFTATSSGGANVMYKWDFGDNSPETPYSSSPTAAYSYADPGIYQVTLTVTDDAAAPHVQTFVQGIHLSLTTNRPSSSTNIVYEERANAADRVWVANQDNDSVTAFDAATLTRVAEVGVGKDPRALAIAPDGRLWVTNKRSHSISVIDPVTLTVVQTIAMPFASQPYGIVFSPVANEAYVALEAKRQVIKLDALTGAQYGRSTTIESPRHLAIDANGSNLYVSRFVTAPQPGESTAVVDTQIGGIDTGGEVYVLETASLTLLDSITLRHSDVTDAENQGRGVPNYVGALAISPDGTFAQVPSKQDNILRGNLRDSGLNLNFQNTVRAISSRIDLAGNSEDYPHRLDLDNASVASAAVIDNNGIYGFVALETSREIAVIDNHGARELFRIDVGRAPQGLAMSPDGSMLYVNNFMDRTVDVFDLAELQARGQLNAASRGTLQAVAVEKLDPQVLAGKQLFYDAFDTRLALDRYMSCASCHNDGSHDGRTWDLTGMGEGLRNTIDLRGRANDQGRKHWTGNFDEVHDFEMQIRILSGGTGLMDNADLFVGTRSEPLGDPKANISADLDALAAYVNSLDTFDVSPFRNSDGSLTSEALAGRQVFRDQGCDTCHQDPEFTDSQSDVLHDIGTITASSGQRLYEALTGFDTPTLRGTWSSAPYLHDGSAATLRDAVLAHEDVSIGESELTQLEEYLKQIDALEGSLDAGLVGYWPMNEGVGPTTEDASGNGHTGVLSGGAQWSLDDGIDFDGVDDYIDVGTFDVSGSALTLAAWVRSERLDNCTRYNDCRVISKTLSTRAQDHYFMLSTWKASSGTQLRFRLKTNGTTATMFADSGNLVENAWMHVAAVYDGSYMRLYLDGVEVGAMPQSGDVSTNSSIPVWIGSNPTNPRQVPWNGQIDEVRVYNRALSVPELLELAGANEAPVANPQSVQVNEDSTVEIVLTGSDPDGDTLTYSVTAAPTYGALEGTGPNLSYTPANDYAGADSFQFSVADGRGGADTAAVSISVQAVNDAPQASADSYVLMQDTTLSVATPGILGNDVDVDGDTLEAVLHSSTGTGTLQLNPNGSFDYTPRTGFVGVDSFEYRVSDGRSESGVVAVTLTVEGFVARNTPPIADDQVVTVPEDTPTAVLLTADDVDGDVLSYAVVDSPANGTLAGIPPNLTYSPASEFTGSDSFTFQANDGEDDSAVAIVSIDVTPVNDPPVAVSTAVATDQNTSLDIALEGTDIDGDPLSYTVVNGPSSGTLAGTPPQLSYIPAADYTGTDSFEFRVSDGNGGEDEATIVITVMPTDPGLVAYWPMDESAGTTVSDASGNGNDGVLQNGTQWQPGFGLVFDGVDDYVDAGNVDVTGTELTLAAWVRSDQLENCARYYDCRIISKATSTAADGHYFMLSTINEGGNVRLRFRLKVNGVTSTLVGSTGNLSADVWMHAAAVYDGAAMRLYLDGVEVGSLANPGQLTGAAAVPVFIGANPPGAEKPWDGGISEVRIYDRALTKGEVLDLAQDPP